MFSLLNLLLVSSPALLPPDPPAIIRQDGQERGEGRREHEGRGRGGDEDGEDRHERHDRRERRQDHEAWKREHMEEENSWRQWAKHHHEDEDDQGEDHDRDFDHPRRAHPCPPWMNPWWANQQGPHYVALVPNDPSRCYVYLDGRWVLRQIGDVDFQVDLGDVMRFRAAPPPIPLPRIGLNLHVVLFN